MLTESQVTSSSDQISFPIYMLQALLECEKFFFTDGAIQLTVLSD